MTITEALLGEHGVFYAQFDHLGRAIPKADTAAEVHAQAAVVAAALATHARVEDELLFAALEPCLGAHMGPLAVMRMDHDEIERALAHVPEVQDLAEAQALVLHTIEVAREHFAKEENVLFPLAQEVLNTRSLAQLGTQWAQRRAVTLA